MVRVPAGEFRMGDESDADNPRHSVKLSEYWIYKTPVTVGQYRRFCQATGRKMPEAPPFNKGWTAEDHPIVRVNWDDAYAYAKWAKVELPTEAQWEKAARGTDGRRYPWGSDWDPGRCRCSTSHQECGGTSPVGSFPSGQSPYGCLDMAGNVWEWCRDWYDPGYWLHAPGADPVGAERGQFRVLRGGSWNNDNPTIFRAAGRFSFAPSAGYASYGFRCVARPGAR
jgi:formylglycine-generating enzyme required for sulfatase activity